MCFSPLWSWGWWSRTSGRLGFLEFEVCLESNSEFSSDIWILISWWASVMFLPPSTTSSRQAWLVIKHHWLVLDMYICCFYCTNTMNGLRYIIRFVSEGYLGLIGLSNSWEITWCWQSDGFICHTGHCTFPDVADHWPAGRSYYDTGQPHRTSLMLFAFHGLASLGWALVVSTPSPPCWECCFKSNQNY
jgi:hypothetical protein